jgi:hypothetical protein
MNELAPDVSLTGKLFPVHFAVIYLANLLGNHDFDFGRCQIDTHIWYSDVYSAGYPHLTTLIKDTTFVRSVSVRLNCQPQLTSISPGY